MRLRLPELLTERGLTVYEFAKLLAPYGIAQRQVYRLVRGDLLSVPFATLDAVCTVLGVKQKDLGLLLTRDKPPKV